MTIEIKLLSAKSVDIAGFNVLLPFEPYPQQIEYIDHLLNALKNSQNTLLEYPRGGGRTLAILAGSFSLLLEELEKNPKQDTPTKIFFVCRNHSRIRDVKFVKKDH